LSPLERLYAQLKPKGDTGYSPLALLQAKMRVNILKSVETTSSRSEAVGRPGTEAGSLQQASSPKKKGTKRRRMTAPVATLADPSSTVEKEISEEETIQVSTQVYNIMKYKNYNAQLWKL